MKAVYYSGKTALEGVVIEEGKNADGPTVTLAETADAEPFVRGAPVSASPQPGYAVIEAEAEPKAKAKK